MLALCSGMYYNVIRRWGMEQLYTISEVAEILKMKERTIEEWTRNGTINAVRVGPKLVRIPREEVERIITPMNKEKK